MGKREVIENIFPFSWKFSYPAISLRIKSWE
jgi:hypothetical protein